MAATTPGTLISNTATLRYDIAGEPQQPIPSNQVDLTVRGRATVEFLKYAPGDPAALPVQVPPTEYRDASALFQPVTAPPETASQPLLLVEAPSYAAGQTLYLRLTDLDQNLQSSVAETVLVSVACLATGDSETLRLTETGPNSGIFTGYLNNSTGTSIMADGRLAVSGGVQLIADYVDANDSGDHATDLSLIDPFGLVFDSRTGLPVDGATITLIDNATGAPATVFGDDGVTSYPATVISGTSASDSAGNLYLFAPGRYRFPFVQAGSYHFEITPPAGFSAPSQAADSDLQNLPGAPFALTDGSRGEDFIVVDPALRIDVPLDRSSAGLWLTKSTPKSTAGIGEIVPYQIRIANSDPIRSAPGITIVDRLPAGFRYQNGSTRVDGSSATDPALSTDGRTLTYNLGDLAPGTTREINYVTAVDIGTPAGIAVNQAGATDQLGNTSNRASARVAIREDLLRSRSFLAGRVMVGDCAQPDTEKSGLKGVRVYLEDGSYTVTDEDGRYHFEGITPERHVVQLDLDTLPPMYEILPCDDNTRFAGRAFSQFVDIQPGALWRADFHVGLRPRATGEATLALQNRVEGEVVHLSLPLGIGGVPLENLRLSILLPDGVTFQPGSARLDGEPLPDPAATAGVLTVRLDDRPAGWQGQVNLSGLLDTKTAQELPVQALLTFDSPQQQNQRTPLAETALYVSHREATVPVPDFVVHPHFASFSTELSADDRQMLDRVVEQIYPFRPTRLLAVGHSDNMRIAPRSRHIFADNFALSKARAVSVARYLGNALGLPPDSIGAEGVADTRPIAANNSEAGRALNRRVELFVEGVKLTREVNCGVLKEASGPQRVATVGTRPGEGSAVADPAMVDPGPPQPPHIDAAWLSSASAARTLVWPPPGYVPETPSTAVIVLHRRTEHPQATLNGTPLDPRNFEGIVSQPGGEQVASIWRGVDLEEGSNRLVVTLVGADGQTIDQQSAELWYVNAAQRVELVSESSRLVADGITAPVLTLRLSDDAGHPVRPGLFAEVQIAPPYRLQPTNGDSTAHLAEPRPRFRVGVDGLVRVTLEPTSRSGEVQVSIPLGERREVLSAWLQPPLRDWIMVGLAEGTAGYNTVSGNMENLAGAGSEEDFYEDGRVAFFAKGRIKGSWLLTLAYDSARERRASLHQTIDPDAYYTLYGDGSTQQYEAASARKLYVKLEREQFYALFGDFDTGLTVTELARYNRSLTGLKSERRGETLDWNLFAAETSQAFVKEELRGDGTSGLYRLSRRDLVLNSEKITIERHDRFHSEVVLEARTLTRHLDYEIDYDLGTLFFKEPVPSRDADLNPVFIVIDYETAGNGDQSYHAGGRVVLKFLDERVVVGTSLLHEGTDGREGHLAGGDVTVKLDAQTEFKGEVATSNVAGPGGSSGAAWLAEVRHESASLSGRLYLREQQPDFGLGQQAASETGMRKYGALAGYRMNRQFSLSGEFGHQDNLESGDQSDLATIGAAWQAARYKLSTGVRQSSDRLAAGGRNESSQILFGAAWQATQDLALRLDHDQSLGSQDASAAYPTRTRLGADYRLTEAVSLFAEQEWTKGAAEDTDSTRLGLKTTPWSGAQADSSVEQQVVENSARVFANLGLKQTWKATARLSLDAGLDRSQTLRHNGNTPVNPDAAPVSGASEDFTAVSVGANWAAEKWSWFSRAEYRTADSEDKWGGSLGAMGEVRDGLGLSARVQFFLTDAAAGTGTSRGETRFGLAWRPRQSRWIVLDRLDLRSERSSGNAAGDFRNWRLVNNLHANLKANRRTQVALQYAFKYVQETVNGRDYDGYTDLAGLETRYDLTPDWDLGARGSVLHSWDSSAVDYSAGLSVGCKVVENAWVSLGYNFTGFTDPDFSGADFTAQGPYLRVRFKFDQQTLKEALSRL